MLNGSLCAWLPKATVARVLRCQSDTGVSFRVAWGPFQSRTSLPNFGTDPYKPYTPTRERATRAKDACEVEAEVYVGPGSLRRF